MPAGLLRAHQAKASVRGKVVVPEGRRRYSIFERALEVAMLVKETCGPDSGTMGGHFPVVDDAHDQRDLCTHPLAAAA
ncbi:hypothetical protein [Halopseudomonas maritima]|uniref:hypothetical protein n=1 Tax=Halopseudomonas maritima TaxID=2918528 RepID=UPI0037C18429